MTKQEALESINGFLNYSREKLVQTLDALHKAIDNGEPRYVKLDIRSFEKIMMDVVQYKWQKQYPGTFIVCYATGDDYESAPKAPYSHYMKVINGSLNNFCKLNELEDYHMHRNGYTDECKMDMFKKRLQVIEELMYNDEIDIIMWSVDNICI